MGLGIGLFLGPPAAPPTALHKPVSQLDQMVPCITSQRRGHDMVIGLNLDAANLAPTSPLNH